MKSSAPAAANEFNTIAVDDGIAMGHGGMLYSAASRDLIADSVEYMVNAHTADAMVCIRTATRSPRHADGRAAPQHPGHLRLRRSDGSRQRRSARGQKVNLAGSVDAMVAAADERSADERHCGVERSPLPDLRFLFRHVHRQLHELPHRGRWACRCRATARWATHADRKAVVLNRRSSRSSNWRVAIMSRTTMTSCCRAISPTSKRLKTPSPSTSRWAAPTNTVLHLLAAAARGEVSTSPWPTSIASRARCLFCPRWRRRCADVPYRRRASRRRDHGILGELDRAGCSTSTAPCTKQTPGDALDALGYAGNHDRRLTSSAAARRVRRTRWPFQPGSPLERLDVDRSHGVHSRQGTLYAGRRPGRALRQHRREGLRRQNGGRR